MDESDLVADLKKRRPEAFHRVCDIHLSSLWRYVYWSSGSDQHLTEDIVGETLLELVESVDSLQPKDNSLGGWLRVVARNKLTDYQRSVARVRRLVEEVSRNGNHRHSPTADPAEQLEKKERIRHVQTLLGRLSDQHRLALEWKYVEGLSVRAIAKRWGTTEKAVESVLFRARKTFRRHAEEMEAEETPHHQDIAELACLASARQHRKQGQP